MKKKILVSMSILVALAFTAAGEEGISSWTLFNTKWNLEGFFNAVTNQLEKPDSIGEDWYTFEFAPDSVVVYEDVEYRICRGNLSASSFWGLYTVNHSNSTIVFEVLIRSTTASDSEDGERFDRVLYLSRRFELTKSELKMYYDDNGNYLQFGRGRQSDIEISRAAPEVLLTGKKFSAGPNPVAKSAGTVNFYREGNSVSRATLKVFDASGKFVRKIQVSDNVPGGQSRRQVGSWDLRDAKGRPVSAGTYLVKGTVKTSDGKREKVSIVLGVR